MYLAYVDDYGHTGADLGNVQQPIYMLFALLVPEHSWATVEASLWEIMVEIADKTGQDLDGFELHAKDSFNGRNRIYSALTFEEKIGYLTRITNMVVALDCKCVATHVIKSELQRIREDAASEKAAGRESISDQILSGLFAHPLAFSRLIAEIDSFSRLAQQNSVIIMDHQEEYVQSRQMSSHTLHRHQVAVDDARTLDMPFDGDGRYNLMLQIADVIGWAFGRHLKTVHLGHSQPPEIAAALAKLIPLITSIDALRTIGATIDMPFGMALFAEFGFRADKTMNGTRRVAALTQLLVDANDFEANKKGKEYPDG